MKYIVCVCLSLSLIACSSKSGKEEKELATQAFINCDFYGAKRNAELAIKYAGDKVEIVVPALLIVAKASEFLEEESAAYEKVVELAPGVSDIEEAKKIANRFVKNLSRVAPEKVKACEKLHG